MVLRSSKKIRMVFFKLLFNSGILKVLIVVVTWIACSSYQQHGICSFVYLFILNIIVFKIFALIKYQSNTFFNK